MMDNPIYQDTNIDHDLKIAIAGRWDLTIRTMHGDLPAWLEVRNSGYHALVGQFVGPQGSARPISSVDVREGRMRFSIPPQWEEGKSDLTLEGRLQGNRLTGTIMFPDGNCYKWEGCRAPALRRSAPPDWGDPQLLFNGVDLSGWYVIGEETWQVEDGILRNVWPGGNLVTHEKFDDFQLHVEFRYPEEGNSAVYLRGRYEVQIIDSPHMDAAIDRMGAIYGFLPPNRVVTRPPGKWNAFDITLVGRMVTVAVNGEVVINQREIPGICGGALDSDEGAPGSIMLQGEFGQVDFRNIVIRPAKHNP
jgi:hypothetical protein